MASSTVQTAGIPKMPRIEVTRDRRLVPDDGPRTAKLVIIGEAPGRFEELRRRPFVGASGKVLSKWMESVGLDRREAYVTNVYPYRPPGNKIDQIPDRELQHHAEQLHHRLAQLDDPRLIVLLGNTPLAHVLGKQGILRHRGSIYGYKDTRGRIIKCIPSIHPAATFRMRPWEQRCRADWERIAVDLAFRELRLPQREHFIRPSLDDVRWMVRDCAAHPDAILSLDIENTYGWQFVFNGVTKAGKKKWKKVRVTPRITMLGVARDPRFSMTIDTTLKFWGSPQKLQKAWSYIRELCALPNPKLFQFGFHDCFMLAREQGIRVRNYKWDTRWLHHCLDVREPHALEYLASIYSREPYWKDEAKDADEVGKYLNDGMDAFRVYNGKDVCVPLEIRECIVNELTEKGRLGEYFQHYASLYPQLLRMMIEGVRRDPVEVRRQFLRLTKRSMRLQNELVDICGEPLYSTAPNSKGDISQKKLAKYLYETLKLPRQYAKNSKGKRAVTTKEVVIRQLQLRYPHRVGEAAKRILEHRRVFKMRTFYDAAKTDPDGRVRTQYSFGPESGRLASKSNPMRTGMNLQNVDRECRAQFVPDEGHLWLEPDFSQGESRIVDILTNDPKLWARARSHPAEYDVHRVNAAKIFSISEDDVTDDQRFLGKKGKHARNYLMQAKKLQEELLKDGYVLSLAECERILKNATDEGVTDWQRRTRLEMARTRKLIDYTWGGEITWPYDRLNDDIFRSGYAWRPQRGLAKTMNSFLFLPASRYLRREKSPIKIRMHVHDSLGHSVPPDVDIVYPYMQFAHAQAERPVVYYGRELMIPVTWTLGTCYGQKPKQGAVEWKRFPSRKEVAREIERLREGMR